MKPIEERLEGTSPTAPTTLTVPEYIKALKEALYVNYWRDPKLSRIIDKVYREMLGGGK